MKDDHLYLNEEQRTLLVAELLADLFSQRSRRGPSPEPEPYLAACQILIEQACFSKGFHLGTKQIQLQISEVQGHLEPSRNRAATARKALVDAGYISMVDAHIRKGDLTAAGVPASRSHAARFQADVPKLVALMREAWRKHREAKGG